MFYKVGQMGLIKWDQIPLLQAFETVEKRYGSLKSN